MAEYMSDMSKTHCNDLQYGKKKAKLCLCLTTQALSHEGVRGSGCIDPRFLDLSTSWR
jgi:hypothetical protein